MPPEGDRFHILFEQAPVGVVFLSPTGTLMEVNAAACTLAGRAEADLVIEGEYEGGRPTPAYMEPNVCVCHWEHGNTDEHNIHSRHRDTQPEFGVLVCDIQHCRDILLRQ